MDIMFQKAVKKEGQENYLQLYLHHQLQHVQCDVSHHSLDAPIEPSLQRRVDCGGQLGYPTNFAQ